ncbi:ATP-NAD kinase [Halomicroarcula sp. GCM10025324]|uniref:ATP-NAD kinase n=1 Tax=Haloarcula TaxID=2237 RepID=UPI0023E7BE1C|nr:ATP-NAD kinase [Halomicroarcula sp. ZS-22-S1]
MTERDSVGVVGDDEVAERLREGSVTVETGTPETVPATDAVVAVGEAAVTAVARAERDPLVVPVDAGRGVRSVPRDRVADAVASLDAARVEHHPLLSVALDDDPVGRAVWDVTLVTADAAHISEYTVASPTDHVGTFRADGVVVSTPAGSPGYARRIGGPVVEPAPVSVVTPIAPFATNPDHWVLPGETVTVTVDRDEAEVSLFVDGTERGTVSYGDSVTLARQGRWRAAVVDSSRSRFD